MSLSYRRWKCAEVDSTSGTFLDDGFHRGGQQPGCGLLHGPLFDLGAVVLGGFIRRIQKDIAILIHDGRVKLGLLGGSAVGDGRVGGVQLNVLYAVGDTAQRQCLVGVCEDLAVDLFTFRTDQVKTKIVDQ